MIESFDFPKPTFLIKKVLKIGGSSNALCVDFFPVQRLPQKRSWR